MHHNDNYSDDTNLVETAVNSALKGKWDVAVVANKKLIKIDPNDTEALNRLARAYCESGEISLAKKTSLKVIKIDHNNQIAIKAIDKYKKYQANKSTKDHVDDQSINASDFIEESGITKQTNLINISSTSVISSLDAGDEVKIVPNGHRLAVTTLANKYIGRLPDDLSAIIKKLIKNNYKYRVLIKSVTKDEVKIFIKETQRGKGFENTKSFPKELLESFGEFTS
ncbi:MAG: tetratricopeptide repeat protein [bacterium]|nr:MAG: tetratricopeptide repeat protein [bacterium]